MTVHTHAQSLDSLKEEKGVEGADARTEIAESSANHRTADILRQLAQKLTGRIEQKRRVPVLLSPLIEKLLQRPF